MQTKEWCPRYKLVLPSPKLLITEELSLYFIHKREKKANESKKTQIQLLIKNVLFLNCIPKPCMASIPKPVRKKLNMEHNLICINPLFQESGH